MRMSMSPQNGGSQRWTGGGVRVLAQLRGERIERLRTCFAHATLRLTARDFVMLEAAKPMILEDSLAPRALQDRHGICLDCDGLAEFRVKDSHC